MLYLEVPFKQKDQAKALGARWDPMQKKWYIQNPGEVDLSQFQAWLPDDAVLKPAEKPASKPSTKAANEFLNSPDLFQPEENLAISKTEPATQKTETKTEQKGIKLSQFLSKIQSVIEGNFRSNSWVIAEIGNLSSSRGHYYFDLTENDTKGQAIASSRAMLWASNANRVLKEFSQTTGAELQIGQQVLLEVSVSFSPKFGFSLVIENIDPAFTLGALEANLIKIRETLIKEGVYQQNKQLKVPSDIFKVAVISPPKAAGLGDFQAEADKLEALQLCKFVYFGSSFQGERVLAEMQGAFSKFLNEHQTQDFDLLVIIRGGGSKLDLHPLNQYEIAKAITQSPIPVFTGIGHERDSTILDEVAHTKFDTPSKTIHGITSIITQAGLKAINSWQMIEKQSNLLVQTNKANLQQLKQLLDNNQQSALVFWQNLTAQLATQVEMQAQARIYNEAGGLNNLFTKIQQSIKTPLAVKKQQLNDSFSYIKNQATSVLQQQTRTLEQNYVLIMSSGPKVQLKRGFAITKTAENQVISSAEQARKQPKLTLEFHDGELEVAPLKSI